MPIFVPLLDNFGGRHPVLGLLVALNLQTAFLSPPVAMARVLTSRASARRRDAEPDLRGLPFHGDSRSSPSSSSTRSRQIGLWIPSMVYGADVAAPGVQARRFS